MGLNSRGEGLWLADSKLLVRCYQEDHAELAVLCLLYGIGVIILGLGKDIISGEVVCSSMKN